MKNYILSAALFLAHAIPSTIVPGEGPPEKDEVAIRKETEKVAIENPFLSIEMTLSGNQEKTRSILNRRTSEATAIDGEDFVLLFAGGRKLRSSDFSIEKTEEAAAGPGGKRLIIHLLREDVRASLITEMHPGEPWAVRWVEVRGTSGRLEKVSLAEWRCTGSWGPSGPGAVTESLGAPEGIGQPGFVNDLFVALDHPGAENFARGKRVCARIAVSSELGGGKPFTSRRLAVGAGEAGGAWNAFIRYIHANRTTPSRMVFLVNDWYFKDKGKPIEAVAAIAKLKAEQGVPVDSFTLDDGWDRDWDEASGLWGRLDGSRFPGGWDALQAAARPAGMGISLWFGPIGGYGEREKRIEFGKKMGYETNGDKLCLAGAVYRKHVIESFSGWASRGMDYIKVDGFWPDCSKADHGHPTGPAGTIAQMDALEETFSAWRKARPDLAIGYTSGSNPSPLWLERCDFLWRGGADDSHAGAGDPFDRHSTYIDTCLQVHRQTDMPVSAFVTFDIVAPRIAGSSDESFERNAWWLAARTSLHHDWYLEARDLTEARWKLLAKVARWAKERESLFRFGRMVGGDPRRGDIYGFSAYDGGQGTLALRNPGAEPRKLERTLANLLGLPREARKISFRLAGVFGETKALEGARKGSETVPVELPPLAVVILEARIVQP